MSHVLSSHVEGVEGDTRVSPFKVFITRNLLMMLMKCVLLFSSGVLGTCYSQHLTSRILPY